MVKIAASITPNNTKFGPLLFPGQVRKGCEFLSSIGYDGIELSLRTPNDMDLNELESILEKYGLDLVSIATGQSHIEDDFSLYHGDEVLRKKAVERICSHIDVASLFGARVILGGIRGMIRRKDFFEEYSRLGEEAICRCADYAQKKHVILLLEPVNRYETNVVNTISDAYEVIERYSLQSNVRILPDAYHMNIEEADPAAALSRYCEYVGAFHCADSNRLAPGSGHIDFSRLLQILKGQAGCHYFGVEVLPQPTSEETAVKAIETIKNAMQE